MSTNTNDVFTHAGVNGPRTYPSDQNNLNGLSGMEATNGNPHTSTPTPTLSLNGTKSIEPTNNINGHTNGVNGHTNGINGHMNGTNGHINALSGENSSSDLSSIEESDYGDATEADGAAPPPIAIVGMGMRLPGGINGESAFWDLLVNKKNGRCVVPEDRYNIEAFYSPSGESGTVKSRYGYFLDHVDLQHLDASFFSMNKTEVEKLDPQQRLLLEVIWECMENGGQVGWRGKDIGCYVGVFGEDWLDMSAKDTQHLGMYRITGSGEFAISNRVSYEYDLGGPRYVLDNGPTEW